MPDERPPWRQIFDAFERAIAAPLEEFFETPEFLAVVAATARIQRAAARAIEDVAANNLHAAGMPALADMRELSRTVARLERRVRELQEQLEDLRDRQGDEQR